MMPYYLILTLLGVAMSAPEAVAADCFRECMDVASCGSSFDSSYCSSIESRCETECRNSPNNPNAAKSYGAIAYSAKDGGYGYSHGWTNQKKAEKVAMSGCKDHGKKCKPAVWFSNGCGAVAADGKKTGWGIGDSARQASQAALTNCAKSGGKNCKVQVSHCSG